MDGGIERTKEGRKGERQNAQLRTKIYEKKSRKRAGNEREVRRNRKK